MRRLSLLLLACLMLGSAWAERISVNTAQQVAANVAASLNPSNLKSGNSLKLVYAAPAQQTSGLRNAGESDYFIFNVGDDGGFIIVSGEDRVRPVLGYSAEGGIDWDKAPANMKAWLEMYQSEISWAVSQGLAAPTEVQNEWQEWLGGTKSMANQGVLLETAKWGQGDPYNRMTPEINGQHTLTGCVATAQAIVMKYYEYPERAIGGVSSYQGHEITYDDYDWENMLPDYNGNYTSEQGDAVAKLMWHCGANLRMNYGTEASGTSTSLVTLSLRNVFGYSQSVQYVEKLAYRWDDWKNLIIKELSEERPVILSGTDSEQGGHAFVCDGYMSEYTFHINWGWGGSANGYFLLTTLDDNGDGAGFAAADYGAIIGIQPEGGEPAVIAPFVTDMKYNGTTNPLPQNLNIHVYWRYSGVQAISYQSGLGVVNEAGEIIQTPSHSYGSNIEEYGGWFFGDTDYDINLATYPLEEGNRIVMLYSLDEGNTWKVMPVGAESPLGLDNNGLIEQGPDEPGEQETPVNFSTYWDHLNGGIFETVEEGTTASYKNTQGVSFSITGLKSDAYLCIIPKHSSTWINALDIYYGDDYSITEEGKGTIAEEENDCYWIPVPLNKIEDGAFAVYLKLITKQPGTFEYSYKLCSKDKETQLAIMEGMSLTFVGDQSYTFDPDPITGERGKPVQFKWIPNIDPALTGKTATVTFWLQGMSSENTTLIYNAANGEETEAVYENDETNLRATVEIANFQNTAYSFTLTTTGTPPANQGQSIYVDDLKVGDDYISLQRDVAEIKLTTPSEPKSITWTFTPEEGLKFPGGGEEWIYLTPTQIPEEYLGKKPKISLNIEGSKADEVKVSYVGSDYTYHELEVTPHPKWPNENQCVTTPYEFEPLTEDQYYIIAFRYTGEFYGGLPEEGDIQLESVTVDGVETTFDHNAGIKYTVTEPEEAIEVKGGESGEMKYDESHKGKTVNIHSDGIYVIDVENASIGTLNIQPGGQIKVLKPLEVTNLTVSHPVPTDEWNTFCVPQSDSNIQLGDGSGIPSGIEMRYGYNSPDMQFWETSEEAAWEPGMAILIAQETSSGNIGFHNTKRPFTIPACSNSVSAGNADKGNWFCLKANPLWENLQINGRAYVLNADENSFELKESPVIPPFQAYMTQVSDLEYFAEK